MEGLHVVECFKERLVNVLLIPEREYKVMFKFEMRTLSLKKENHFGFFVVIIAVDIFWFDD